MGSPRVKTHSINIVSKDSKASFWKLRSPSSSGSRTLNLPLCTYVPRKDRGKGLVNISKYEATIHISDTDNYHVCSFQWG